MQICWNEKGADRPKFNGLVKRIGALLETNSGYLDLVSDDENVQVKLSQSLSWKSKGDNLEKPEPALTPVKEESDK